MNESNDTPSTSSVFNNVFSSALFVPACDLLIQPQAYNGALYADQHAMATPHNDTAGFMHAVVSQVTSEKLCALMKGANIKKKQSQRVGSKMLH